MDTAPPSQMPKVLLWLTPLALFVGAIGSYFATWLNRKRSGERAAEVHKSEAEALNQKAEARLMDVRAVTEAFESLRETQSYLQEQIRERETMRAAHAQRETDWREREHRMAVTEAYIRDTLAAYVGRHHETSTEFQALLFWVTNLREDLAVAVERIKAIQTANNLPHGTEAKLTELVLLITPKDIRLKTAKEINAKHPFPKTPDGVEPLHSLADSGERTRPKEL